MGVGLPFRAAGMHAAGGIILDWRDGETAALRGEPRLDFGFPDWVDVR